MNDLVARLHPGQDLRGELESLCEERSMVVLTCVGSLQLARLRLAGANSITELRGPFEICSLVGTLCPDGAHLHISLADSTGQMIGGHLSSGCIIYTTAEVALAELSTTQLSRAQDPETGYAELVVNKGSS